MAKQKKTTEPRVASTIHPDSDSEIDEDEAFNSEDERMYGSFFKSTNHKKKNPTYDSDNESSTSASSSDDDDSGIASDDDDEEGDGGQYMLSLLENLDKKSVDAKESDKVVQEAGRAIAESEFNTTKQQVTMDQLMSGLSDTKGFKALQNTFANLENNETTKAPIANVVSERAMRKVGYREKKKDMKLWDRSTKEIRDADTLDFRPSDSDRGGVKVSEIVSKFEPGNDFERNMADLLQSTAKSAENAGVDDKIKSLFDDDLGEAEMTLDDLKKRRGELSKLRSLLFYEEQKRNKINKIKSKMYRKIRKRQNERAKGKELETAMEEDTELAREMEEKRELERMEERMTLHYKNTTKWAKQQLKRGAGIDKESRQALSAQLQIGDNLRRKMESVNGDDNDYENLTNEELVARAKGILRETEDDINNNKNSSKGLHDMAFMKRGLEIQKQRAKEEAKKLLIELEEDLGEDDNTDSSDIENDTKKSKLPKTASAKEVSKVLPKGKLVVSALEFSNSNTVSVSGGISVDNDVKKIKATENKVPSQTLEINDEETTDKIESSASPKKGIKSKIKLPTSENNSEYNPWMQTTSAKSERKEKSRIVDFQKAALMVTDKGEKNKANGKNEPIEKTREERLDATKKSTNLSQSELVRKAFAVPDEKELEKELEAEKTSNAERDNPIKVDDGLVSGWGAWAGEGAPPPRPPKKLPKKLQAPEAKKRKRRRDEHLKSVIINEKRIKKNAKYCVDIVPYPYTSRAQYERAMEGAIGREWNVTSATKKMSRPEIVSRAGVIINPISMKKKNKSKRAPAKF